MRSLVVLAALCAVAHADPADPYLAKNLAARGGADKLAAIKSLKLTGRIVFGGTDFSIDAAWGQVQSRPDKIRSEVTLQGLTSVSAYDGREGWRVSPFEGRRDAEKTSEDDARALAQEAELDGPLVDWRAKGHKIEMLGSEDIDGTPAYKLRVTRRDGDVWYVYLDPATSLEVRITKIHKVRGAEQITETDFGGYQQVAGVWIPFSIESGSKGGPRTSRIAVEHAEVNVKIDDAWFKVPTGAVSRVISAPAGEGKPEPIAVPAPTTPATFAAGTIAGLGARNIGSATMSGRIAAVAGVNEGGKTTLFVGAASGGVWRSYDDGTTFKPVFDEQPVQSIGAIAIDPSNPKTIYVGTGEAWTRNSVSVGDGIYKSTDGGETWKNVGLPESERVVRIIVHPHDGRIVYACVPGKLWSDSADRGLYKSSDGGASWQLVLKGANLSTGCSSVTMDPKNPDALIAGMWDFRRKGWTFRSGGESPDAPSGSAMFRSTDGGRTWTPMTSTANRGLPMAPWGRVEVVYAPSDPKVVYAMIESKSSGLYRSDDGGATWEARDKSQKMVWRPFYFARLVVDPTNPNRVFKPDLGLIVSDDGGRSFSDTGGGSHGDWHDLWIDPQNAKHIVGGDDGGFWLSRDGGNRWWKGNNLPVSQFYHVSLDMKDPYQVYGGLQDNSSWVGDSAYPGGITNQRWENLCGGDGFWAYPDPTDPNAVYCESQGGYISRIDRKTMASRDIQPKAGYHEKLRFNWNTPIAVSPTQKGTIYLGSQFLFRSKDRGDTWQRISPDLTTNDPDKQKQEQSGGVTIDNSSAEMHTTIYSIAESPKNPNMIWIGTDDGNLQLTRDAGKSWTNLTANIPGLPKNSWVSWIEASRFDANTAYATFDRHTFGDMTPWIYRTTDAGKTWAKLPTGLVRGFAHTIKEDTVKKDLLFLGTELGLWISIDGGQHWAQFKGHDFPDVAVREVQVHPRDGDLVIATHGRGIWIIDDLSPLRALTDPLLQEQTAFLPGRTVQQRMPAGGGWVEGDATFVGDNPSGGAVISYYLRSRHIYGPIKLEVLDDKGKVVDTITPSKHPGINRVGWGMRVKPPRVPRAAQVDFGSSQGPRVIPGTYTIRLTRGNEVKETKITIGLDRRAPFTAADRKAHFDAMMKAHVLFGDMSTLVDKIEAVREALDDKEHSVPDKDPTAKKLRDLHAKLDEIKKKIVATTEGGAITGEERIREHLGQVYGALNGWEGRPAKYQLERIDVLRRELTDVDKDFKAFVTNEVKPLVPEVTEVDPLDEPDPIALHCAATEGRDCNAAAATATERD
jgi:photosystem II stability/assembly factor-like uncharacterized protein